MAKTILLADDSLTIQKVVELTFMDQDYHVMAVGDGLTALTRWTEVQPDLVIADVHMPGADGYEVCRQVKRSRPGTPVLLLVGTFETFDEAQAQSCGANGHLKKPFDSQELFRLAERLIADSAARQAPAPAPSFQAAAPAPSFQAPMPAPSFPAPAPVFAAPAPAASPFAAPASPFAAPAAAPSPFAAPADPFSFPPAAAAPAPAAPVYAPPAPAPTGFSFGQPAAEPAPAPAAPAFSPAASYAPEPSYAPAPSFASQPAAPVPSFAAEPSFAPAPAFTPEPARAPEPAFEPAPAHSAPPEPVAAAPVPAAPSGDFSLSDADVERIARRVAELIGERAVKDIAWEVLPDLAEVVIRERIRELENQVQ